MQTNKTEWEEGNYTLKVEWNYDGKSDSVSKEFDTEIPASLPITTTAAPLQTAQQQTQGTGGLTVGGATGDIMFYVIVGVLVLVIVALLAVVLTQRRRA
jgi:hypothetical protein